MFLVGLHLDAIFRQHTSIALLSTPQKSNGTVISPNKCHKNKTKNNPKFTNHLGTFSRSLRFSHPHLEAKTPLPEAPPEKLRFSRATTPAKHTCSGPMLDEH
uniref:(northern house mosquito) hypothetical protein n=1 Tax=Culex pipiens TaxID=7175 RepID=A0A8D8GEY1_CULPI